MKSKVVIFISLVFTACSSSVRNSESEDIWKGFNPCVLEKAWANGDTAEIDKWIASLSDMSLPDPEFYSRVADISNVTGFCYGNADPTEKSYWTISQDERLVNKRNIAKVYQLYRESCLFMQKTSWDETLLLQDRYWNDSTELEPEKLKLISQAIDSLCEQ